MACVFLGSSKLLGWPENDLDFIIFRLLMGFLCDGNEDLLSLDGKHNHVIILQNEKFLGLYTIKPIAQGTSFAPFSQSKITFDLKQE